jgi:hypothetical protein
MKRWNIEQEGGEVMSPRVGSSAVNSAANSLDNPLDNLLVSSLDRSGGPGLFSLLARRETGETTVAWGIKNADHLQLQAERTGEGSPLGNGEYPAARNAPIPPRVHNAIPLSAPTPSPQTPVSLDNTIIAICNELEPFGEVPEESPMIWQSIQRIIEALEASRASRTMREQLTSVLYTSEFVRLTESWEEEGITLAKPQPPATEDITPGFGYDNVPPDDVFPGRYWFQAQWIRRRSHRANTGQSRGENGSHQTKKGVADGGGRTEEIFGQKGGYVEGV